MTRHIILALLSVILAFNVSATDYEQLEVKASRFYHYAEWPSALAMYQLMLDKRPDIPATYCHAIIASAMSHDTTGQMQHMRRSMDAGIPLDSIYDGVRNLAFTQGDASLYESFLIQATESFPWLSRNINARLLDYYRWRNDADGIIKYAGMMLKATPENINFLNSQADGLFMNGDFENGIPVYLTVIALDPDNYHALLVLGNYYAGMIATDRFNEEAPVLARQYLSRAYSILPTPYVKSLLSTL